MSDRSDLTTTTSGLVVPERVAISRRRVVGAAAWAAPAIVVAGAVPAFAASGDALARTTPLATTFSATQTSTTQPLSVTLTNNGSPVEGRNIVFSVTATNGGTTTWLTFTADSAVTGPDGVASTTLQYGTPRPAPGSTYTISAIDPSDAGLQVTWTLTYSPTPTTVFSSDFSGIGSAFPPGFSIRTGASTTALGTALAFNDANYSSSAGAATSAWASTTGNFRNVASATSTPSGANSAAQAAATDRAFGVRPSNSFIDDTGGAFVVALGPTTGRSSLKVSFKFQTVATSATKSLTWVVDAGTSTGSNFANRIVAVTTPSTLISGATAQNQSVTAEFGTGIDNLAGNVFVRVFLLSSSGTGARPTTAIDDLVITWI